MSINEPEYIFKAKILRIVDGDTFDAIADLGFGITSTQRFRLKGVDTPETWRPSSEAEATHGKLATEYVRSLIENKTVLLKTYKDRASFGRYIADLWLLDSDNRPVNDLGVLLEKQGLLKLDNY